MGIAQAALDLSLEAWRGPILAAEGGADAVWARERAIKMLRFQANASDESRVVRRLRRRADKQA